MTEIVRWGLPVAVAILVGALAGIFVHQTGWSVYVVGGLVVPPMVLWACWWTLIRCAPSFDEKKV